VEKQEHVLRGSLRSLGVNLQVDPDGVQITGSVSDTHWTANLVAFRNTFNRKSNPATALAGTYTLQIPLDSQSTNGPVGVGVASIKIDLAGKVLVAGGLADGSKVTQATALSDLGAMFLLFRVGHRTPASCLKHRTKPAPGQMPLPKGVIRYPCTIGHCRMCRRTLPLELECVGLPDEPAATMIAVDSRQAANTMK